MLNYKQGLNKLRDIVERQKPETLSQFSVLESRLLEALEREQLFGQSSNNDANRSEALYRLVQFAREHFDIEFIDLCRPDEARAKLSLEEDVPTLPAKRHQEVWTGGSEIFIKGVKYIIHEPVEIKWSSDKSVLSQQARALQTGTSRMVWLKQVQLHRATAIAAAWKDAQEKEGRLLDTLAPNLPQRFPNYLDYESTTSAITLVCSAVLGESWVQYFNPSDEPLSRSLTRTLLSSAISLCDTLKPLHAKRYAHRSLQPEKIFLIGGARNALLQDFGLATWKYASGEGPELYRAPEQTAANKSLPGPYTDVYQLGMILYHFTTGQIPLSPQQVLPPRTWNSELSVEQDAVLQRAIAFNIKERWQSAAEFSSALKRVL